MKIKHIKNTGETHLLLESTDSLGFMREVLTIIWILARKQKKLCPVFRIANEAFSFDEIQFSLQCSSPEDVRGWQNPLVIVLRSHLKTHQRMEKEILTEYKTRVGFDALCKKN